jgi:hypothetical protein
LQEEMLNVLQVLCVDEQELRQLIEFTNDFGVSEAGPSGGNTGSSRRESTVGVSNEGGGGGGVVSSLWLSTATVRMLLEQLNPQRVEQFFETAKDMLEMRDGKSGMPTEEHAVCMARYVASSRANYTVRRTVDDLKNCLDEAEGAIKILRGGCTPLGTYSVCGPSHTPSHTLYATGYVVAAAVAALP